MYNYKAILFDVDGVVITSDYYANCYSKLKDIPVEYMLDFFKGEFQDCLINKKDLLEILPKYLKDWKFEGTAQDFLQSWFNYESKIDQSLITEVQKLRQHGVKCVLATNQEKHRANYLWNRLNLKDYFDEIYDSAKVGYKKPDPNFYNFILGQINCNAQEVLYFDDTLSLINESSKLGIKSIHYKSLNDLLNNI